MPHFRTLYHGLSKGSKKTEIQEKYIDHPKIIWTDGPILELSSSFMCANKSKESKEYRSLSKLPHLNIDETGFLSQMNWPALYL